MASFNPASILGPEFFTFLLPWLFTFAVVYGLLYKLGIFGKNDKISLALAFVIAFFVSGTVGPQMALFFTNIFAGATMYLAGILVFVMFLAMIGYDMKALQHKVYLIAVVLIAIGLFLGSSGSFGASLVIDSNTAMIAFWLIIIVVAVYLITTDKSSGGAGGGPTKKPGE